MKIPNDIVKQARQTNMLSYLEYKNKQAVAEGKIAPYLIERQGNQYKLKGRSGLLFKENYWNQRATTKGGNTLDFLKEIEGMTFEDAVKELTGFAKEYEVTKDSLQTPKEYGALKNDPKKPFVLPERADNYRRAIAYLTKTRGIDAEILLPEFKKGNIYEDKEYHNVVFVGRDQNDEAMWAQKRSTLTGKRFIADAPGSDSRFTFKMGEHNARTVVVVESPIEALSLKTLMKMKRNLSELSNITFLSLGGVHDTALEQYLKDNPNCKGIITALNNDFGDKPGVIKGREASSLIEEKYIKKGYSVGSIFPISKDWNNDLCNIRMNQPKKEEQPLTAEQSIEKSIKNYAQNKQKSKLITRGRDRVR